MQEEFDYQEWRKKFHQQEEERQRSYQDLFHLPGKNLREPEYLIDKLLPQGYLAIMAGNPKAGKTCLATAMAFAVANGSDFAGLKVKQGSVLWLSLEESPQERAAALGNFQDLTNRLPDWPDDEETKQALIESTGWEPKDLANLPIFTCYERIPIDTEDGIAALQHWQGKTDAKLIVVDPLHAAHSGRSLTDGWSARKTLQLIKRFATQTRTSILILHHLSSYGKNLRVAESAQLSACASMFMLLTSPSLHLSRAENPNFEQSPIANKWREGPGVGGPSAASTLPTGGGTNDASPSAVSSPQSAVFTLTC
jgi:RecA-family ATPase